MIEINFDDLIELKSKQKRISKLSKYITNSVLYSLLVILICVGIINYKILIEYFLCGCTSKGIRKLLLK